MNTNQRIHLFVGAGGVGKTTLSASFAMSLAQNYKTLVITIDPSKRLKDALGLEEGELRQVQPNLYGYIPKSTQISEHLKSMLKPETFERLKKNRIFEKLTSKFSGAENFMTLQVLNQLIETHHFEKIVIDTPPDRDFLNLFQMPEGISDFLKHPLIEIILKPTHKMVQKSFEKTLEIFNRLTGENFISEFFEFIQILSELKNPYSDKMNHLKDFFSKEPISISLVLTPEKKRVAEGEVLLQNPKFRPNRLFWNKVLNFEDAKDLRLRKRLSEQKNAFQRFNLPSIFVPETNRPVINKDDLENFSKIFEKCLKN